MKKIIFAFAASLFLFGCASAPTTTSYDPKLEEVGEYKFNPKELDIGNMYVGGFSGLTVESVDAKTGDIKLVTLTDRGPNLDPMDTKRPFLVPTYTPRIVHFRVNRNTKKMNVTSIVEMKNGAKKMTGLPNILNDSYGDEPPIGPDGKDLSLDAYGLDTEGIARDKNGSFWMVEEYRPSILHFSASGSLLSRWVPKGQSGRIGTGTLPEYFGKRVQNRGFEGVAIDKNSVFAFLQSGLKEELGFTHILQVNKSTGKPSGEFIYPFESAADKIGDAVALGDNQFLVIEQNSKSGGGAFRRIYRIELEEKNNILASDVVKPSEGISVENFCNSPIDVNCIHPIRKTLVLDLTKAGMARMEKAEGLAVIDNRTLAVMGDNDFGAYASRKSIQVGKPMDLKKVTSAEPSVMFLLKFKQPY